MGPENNTMEGGVLYYASPSGNSEWTKLGPIVSIPPFQIDGDPDFCEEGYQRLGKRFINDLTASFTININTHTRSWRRIRRIMRKARQQAKRRWEKRKRTGGSLYDC